MVVNYFLSCKELTALQSCRKKKSLYKILIDSWNCMRSPPGVLCGGVSVTDILDKMCIEDHKMEKAKSKILIQRQLVGNLWKNINILIYTWNCLQIVLSVLTPFCTPTWVFPITINNVACYIIVDIWILYAILLYRKSNLHNFRVHLFRQKNYCKRWPCKWPKTVWLHTCEK